MTVGTPIWHGLQCEHKPSCSWRTVLSQDYSLAHALLNDKIIAFLVPTNTSDVSIFCGKTQSENHWTTEWPSCPLRPAHIKIGEFSNKEKSIVPTVSEIIASQSTDSYWYTVLRIFGGPATCSKFLSHGLLVRVLRAEGASEQFVIKTFRCSFLRLGHYHLLVEHLGKMKRLNSWEKCCTTILYTTTSMLQNVIAHYMLRLACRI